MLHNIQKILLLINFLKSFLFSVPTLPPTKCAGVNISKNAIRVSWDVIPRADRNGIILGYNIYTTEAFNYFARMPADYIAPQKGTLINTTDEAARSFIQLDLVPYTDYSFQVDAFTSKGKGPTCASFIVRTEEEGIHAFISLGTGHYLWRAVAPKTNVFLNKTFADPTIKKSLFFYPMSNKK